MSSSPIADLGRAGGGGSAPAASAMRTLRQRLDIAENAAAAAASAVGSGSGGEGEAGRGAAGVVPPVTAERRAADNVIELDPPQLRLAGARRGPRLTPSPARINPRAVVYGVRLADAMLAAGTGALAYLAQPGVRWPLDPIFAFTALAVLAMLVRFPSAEPRLLHDAMRRPLPRRLADAALRTLSPFVFSLFVVLALVPAGHGARGPLSHWLAVWAIMATLGTCAVRLALAGAVAHWRKAGRLTQAVAIFGTGDIAERLLARLQAMSSPETVELVGIFDDRERRRIANPVLRGLTAGSADDLIALSRRRDIDRVLVALPHAAEHRLVEVLKKLRQMPVEICLAPDLVGYSMPFRDPNELAGLPLIEVYGQPLTFGQVLLKGMIDRLLAAFALIVGAPLFAALALAIKLDSKGPVLFRQNRYGFGDRMIGVYKFRTMTAEAADYDGTSQATPNDPRVTRVGHFLRRWSVDELPQLINVLRGEMSLVGPRPHAVSMRVEDRLNHDIVPDYALRHHMKPGITGWAQVNGYHGPVATEEALQARVRYDLEYINNWSLWFDLQILVRTVRIVLGQRHAY